MDILLEKLKEYLKMENVIAFEEFSAYYNNLIEELTQSFDGLDRDGRLKAFYICSVVHANAESRIKENKSTAKSFKKMSNKCGFWRDAIKFRLIKDGMTEKEIEQETELLNSEG